MKFSEAREILEALSQMSIAQETEVESWKWISPRDLRPGMEIRDGRKWVRVKYVEACAAHRRGVGCTHVNERLCYDNAATVTVR